MEGGIEVEIAICRGSLVLDLDLALHQEERKKRNPRQTIQQVSLYPSSYTIMYVYLFSSAPPTSTMDSETVDLFRYDLVSPVNLSHGHSALVSIFDSVVQGRKVALYNPTLHKHHPFSTLVMSVCAFSPTTSTYLLSIFFSPLFIFLCSTYFSIRTLRGSHWKQDL